MGGLDGSRLAGILGDLDVGVGGLASELQARVLVEAHEDDGHEVADANHQQAGLDGCRGSKDSEGSGADWVQLGFMKSRSARTVNGGWVSQG